MLIHHPIFRQSSLLPISTSPTHYCMCLAIPATDWTHLAIHIRPVSSAENSLTFHCIALVRTLTDQRYLYTNICSSNIFHENQILERKFEELKLHPVHCQQVLKSSSNQRSPSLTRGSSTGFRLFLLLTHLSGLSRNVSDQATAFAAIAHCQNTPS